ncbi:VOC family protein [Methylobacterium sp. E-046]|uniref:VOC family protein n=1 Tax=Methylobacterium sp. E-046 TaxID=2836576 RepID=UPI001FBA835C|nr:VOC family protein [Methylobacterium sp. E-046]MCJ2101851.1 VOC family protein [Methylobacterium sp. E-046]
MIDHASIAVRDLAISAALYECILAPLGLDRLVDRTNTVGFGKKYPDLWLNHRPTLPPLSENTGAHVCLRAPDVDAVRNFHDEALAHGCRDAGQPGLRRATVTTYFGAFIFDLDGNKIEAISFPSV